MISLFHFARLAMQNLRRGGQRVLVALLCITFGVMALVAMTMIADSIQSTLLVTPAQLIGGDISMVRKSGDAIRNQDIDQLDSLQQSGQISSYTLIASSTSIMFHTSGSGEMHFAGIGMGIQPDRYPLAGSLAIGKPGSTGLPTLLQQVGDALITRDLAEEYNLKVGDAIILADARVGVPVEARVRGIAYDTPNHQGDKIYYSLETAQKLANGQPGSAGRSPANTVIVNTAHAQAVSATLDNSGWSVDWVAGRRDKQTANGWVLGLRGAGILGLLVGGIGIANTMQVLVRRRQREIAIWKTLGYRQADLRLIFSLEAGLLGLGGSLLGAGLGILISGQVLLFFRRASSLLYDRTFSITPPLMGILVGTLTTVIFAYWAIIISGQARPMALLRNEPVDVRHLPGCQSIVLGLLLALPFLALTSLVMGSLLAGIGVIVAILIGIAVLGGFFKVLLWVFTRFLPLRAFPLVRMAFNSLNRSGVAVVFAMIALFAGVLSMSLGLAVMQISERQLWGHSVDFQSYNLDILATPDQESAIRQAIEAQNPQKVAVGYRTALESLRLVGGSEQDNENIDLSALDAILVGRSDPQDYIINGAEWGSQPDGAYAYRGANLKAGSQVQVTFRDGMTRTFTVVGSYDINYQSINLLPPTGLLVSAEAFKKVARPDSLSYFVQVAPDQLNRTAIALGAALPQATVLNLVAYAARFMQSYRRLFFLPMALAGLALLAGFLLVANSVSLALLDRRYEIGILKTVGYSRRKILSIFAVEYGLVGLLATGAGVLLTQGLLAALAIASQMPLSVLLLNPQSLTLIALCGIGLTLLTVFGVTWTPTRVPPVIVLNERNA